MKRLSTLTTGIGTLVHAKTLSLYTKDIVKANHAARLRGKQSSHVHIRAACLTDALGSGFGIHGLLLNAAFLT